MSFEKINSEENNIQNNTDNSLEKSIRNAHEDGIINEDEIKQIIENHNVSKEEIILTFNGILKNEIEKTYLLKYPKIAGDVKAFLNDIFSDNLIDGMSIFNQKEFTQLDNQEGLSEYEKKVFLSKLDDAIKRMNLIESYRGFTESHNNSIDYSLGWSNKDKFVAAKLDMNSFYVPTKGRVNVTKEIFDSIGDNLSSVSSISKEELHKMREKQFDITSLDSMKDFVLLLGVEIGEGLQDILKLLLNIGAGVTLSPRYISNKLKIEGEVDTKKEAKLKIENERLLEQNPSLALIELASNGGEIIKELAKKMVSGKNGDVALGVVSTVGLLAGGAGAIKLVGKGAKIAGKGTKLGKIGKKIEVGAGKIGERLDRIDTTITTGGLNKIKLPSSKDKVNTVITDYKTLQENGNLNKIERVRKTEKLIGRELVDTKQSEGLQTAHEYKSEEFSKLAHKEYKGTITQEEKTKLTQIRIAKGKRLRDSGFSSNETKKILDNGLAGVFEFIKKKGAKAEKIINTPIKSFSDYKGLNYNPGDEIIVVIRTYGQPNPLLSSKIEEAPGDYFDHYIKGKIHSIYNNSSNDFSVDTIKIEKEGGQVIPIGLDQVKGSLEAFEGKISSWKKELLNSSSRLTKLKKGESISVTYEKPVIVGMGESKIRLTRSDDNNFYIQFGENQTKYAITGETTIGRSKFAKFGINDDSISGKHVSVNINKQDGTVEIKDLNSTNGTNVYGEIGESLKSSDKEKRIMLFGEKYQFIESKNIKGAKYNVVIPEGEEISKSIIDLKINGTNISFPTNGKIISESVNIKVSPSGWTHIEKNDGTDFKIGFASIPLKNGGRITSKMGEVGIKTIERKFQKVTHIGRYTLVELGQKTLAKSKDYDNRYKFYEKEANESGLFEIGKTINAHGVKSANGGMQKLIGIMLSEKGVASDKWWGALTNGGDKSGGYFKDTFSGLHGPYFVIKNNGNPKDYNYLFPDSQGIRILSESLDELIQAGEMDIKEKTDILARSFTYREYTNSYKNLQQR